MKITSLILGIAVIFLGCVAILVSLLAMMALVCVGVVLAINGFLSSESKKEVSFKIAWNSFTVKLLTLFSVAFTLSLGLNIYAYSFDVVSTNVSLQNELNNVDIQYQNRMSQLNLTIIELQNGNALLEDRIRLLEDIIKDLSIQESELQERLRLFMVRVYGRLPRRGLGSWYESIIFSANGVDHAVEVKDGAYTIELRNNQNYSVRATGKNFFLAGFVEQKGDFLLVSEAETVEKNWQ